jgi:PIN domain nuclease of toxin-antitoxin system
MPTKISRVREAPLAAPTRLLLDTHVVLWLSAGTSSLKKRSSKIIEDHFRKRTLCVSPISAWEIGLLVSKGRLDLDEEPLAWFRGFISRFCVNVLEITPEIAISSSFLPGVFHGDPADRILVTTAISHSITVLTADREILGYRHVNAMQA